LGTLGIGAVTVLIGAPLAVVLNAASLKTVSIWAGNNVNSWLSTPKAL
jgi:hypothetical protein